MAKRMRRRSPSTPSPRSRVMPTPTSLSPTARRSLSAATRTRLGQMARRVAGRALSRVVPAVGTASTAYDIYKYVSAGRKQRAAARAAVKARRNRKGASMSKSAGFISNAPSMAPAKVEMFMDKGVVATLEQGDVVSNTRAVTYLAHSTNPRDSTMTIAIGALLKKLFNKAGIKIKNWDFYILDGTDIPARVEIVYKERDGGPRQRQAFTMPTNKTLRGMVNDIKAWLDTFTPGNYPQQFLELQYFHDIGTIGSSRLIAYEIDLQSVKLHYHCRSSMKIQNRTINSTGNNEADDVDNVPLYGRHFTVNGNGAMYRDYPDNGGVGSTPYLTTDKLYGVLNYSVLPLEAGTTLYGEVPVKSQLTGVKQHGNIHLDPGEVKTSAIVHEATISWNGMIQRYYSKAGTGVNNKDAQRFTFGKTRILAMEKMINAVAVDATNAPRIAYEHNLELACYATIYQNYQTAKSVTIFTGPIVAS